jgi:hypothetical protein
MNKTIRFKKRVTGGEKTLIKGDINYTISHRTELERLNKDVMTDGLDGMVKKVISCMIEKKYLYS